ncbi:DUF6542 domain-containing protein [Streptomyces sp. V4-01]|uniref:DUF6542 domain-containing protein n=1 Tax=Actinacidiphila polyblastidii TaxID=3110430 RepID=A0ABU7PCI5_9ACTN|nr:DUF6542 domain-containing protein [Streptomyces sp. V4-01]
MDQHTARTGPGPAPAGETSAGVYRAPRPAHPAGDPARRPRTAGPPGSRPGSMPGSRPGNRPGSRPRPRLTGLGAGALTTVVTALGGAADAMLFGGPGVLFGVVFVAVSVAGAVYVRPYDLVAAPVAAPIAFAVGIALTADSGTGGLVGHLIGVFTGLATMTGWLYTGTALAALIVGVRALRLPSRRRRSRRCSEAPPARSPR